MPSTQHSRSARCRRRTSRWSVLTSPDSPPTANAIRHVLANFAIYALATLLFLGAAIFAWVRSAQVVFSNEQTLLERFEPADAETFAWLELGENSYLRNCTTCHRGDGSGWDQYPGVAHTSALFAAENGREHVINLHIYGLTSRRFRAPMPPMGHIPDPELAAVINYVMYRWGNEAQVEAGGGWLTPDDIRQHRGQGLTPAQVNASRPGIEPS